MNFGQSILAFVVVILGAVALSFLLSYPLMLLWNLCLVPAVTTLKEVGWLQMWGIVFLLNCLFKTSVSTKKD
jgi:hypothetical protein